MFVNVLVFDASTGSSEMAQGSEEFDPIAYSRLSDLPPPVTYGKSGQIMKEQAREVVARVIQFMKHEARVYQTTDKLHIPTCLIPITNYKQRVLAATGICEKTYKSINKETAQIKSGTLEWFQTPSRLRAKKPQENDEESDVSPKKKTAKKRKHTIIKQEPNSVYLLEYKECPAVQIKSEPPNKTAKQDNDDPLEVVVKEEDEEQDE